MNKCRVCSHPDRAAIDAALVKGATNRRVSSQYGMSETSVRRHLEHAALAPARVKAEGAKAQSTADQVSALVALATDVVEEARLAASEPPKLVEAMRELGRLLELQAKMTGELAPKKIQSESSVSVDLGSEWVALRTAILRTLDGHPDARAAVIAAIAEQEPPHVH